jgi:hypothetical protein
LTQQQKNKKDKKKRKKKPIWEQNIAKKTSINQVIISIMGFNSILIILAINLLHILNIEMLILLITPISKSMVMMLKKKKVLMHIFLTHNLIDMPKFLTQTMTIIWSCINVLSQHIITIKHLVIESQDMPHGSKQLAQVSTFHKDHQSSINSQKILT